ncbi:hypothetical protein GCM10018952_03800 [Streptosporangium vulgare]
MVEGDLDQPLGVEEFSEPTTMTSWAWAAISLTATWRFCVADVVARGSIRWGEALLEPETVSVVSSTDSVVCASQTSRSDP